MRNRRLFRTRADDRPTDVLQAIQQKACDIRKLLKKKRLNREARGARDEAVKLAEFIERIAAHSSQLTAEDAQFSLDILEAAMLGLEELCERIWESRAGASLRSV